MKLKYYKRSYRSIDSMSRNSSVVEHVPVLPDPCADWVLVSRHNVFLSHSGTQKSFVEQLCVDLERARQLPFFDKRLPRGQPFSQRIWSAARECELAVVVISEEYFSRSKWPMLELAALVQAPTRPRIVPLFFGLSCKEFKRPKRRERWMQAWAEWAREDRRVDMGLWTQALQELQGRTGIEYVKAVGEVAYRRDIVATVCDMLHDEVSQQITADLSASVTLPMINYFQPGGRVVQG